MTEKYELYQVIVQDENGKLYNFNSDYMNENFEVTEHDDLTPIMEEDYKRLHDIMISRYNFVVDLLTEEQHRELHEWYVRTGVIEE